MIIEKNGHRILTLDDWHRIAPPKSADKHWVDNRSAKEVARAWLEDQPALPREIRDLLSTAPDVASAEVERVEPEAVLYFDGHRGPRNADLAIWAHDSTGPIAVTVEAKADEEFDKVVTDVLSDSLEELVKTPRSGRVARITALALSLFDPIAQAEPRISTLRYQLLTATAGTLAHAATIGAGRAVLIIHEFVTPATSRALLARNSNDLDAFVRRISGGRVEQLEPGQLYGPYSLPGKPLFEEPAAFYIGKAVRHVGTPLD